MTWRRVVLSALVPLLLAGACLALLALRPVALKTSLYDLVGSAAERFPEAVRTQSAGLVPVVVSSADPQAARAPAEALEGALRSDDACRSVRLRVDGEGLSEILDFVGAHRAGLASPEAQELLATPEGRAKLARRFAKRIYSDPTPTLFSVADDPFGLAEGFVRSQQTSVSGWTPRDGMLTAEDANGVHVLLLLDLKPETAADTDALIAFKERLDAACASVARDGVTIVASGVPLHTATTARACKTEITWLSVVSLLFIAGLSVLVFRSVRWIPWILFSLLVSGLAGGLALVAFFPSVHLMTLVFGTTLLGLVIDYSFHWLLQDADHRPVVIRSLVISWATTEVSLLPLALSSLPVLRQSATFLGAGLAAALLTVLFLYPREYPTPTRGRRVASGDGPVASGDGPVASRGGVGSTPRTLPLVVLIVLAPALAGLVRVRFATTPQALYTPTAELAAAERQFAELSGATDPDRGVLVVSGSDDLDGLLAVEEGLGLPADVPHLSRFLPSLSVRRAVAEDMARLYAEQGTRQAELLGLPALVPPPAPEAWTWDGLPEVAARPFACGRSLVVSSVPRPSGELPAGVVFCQPRRELAEVLSVWTREALARLGVSLLLMLGLLAVVFRGRAVRILLPSLVALSLVAGILGALNEPVNLFHLLAAFLLVGMSLDYTVFLHGGGRAALRPAFCSLATSLVGFGLLAFVSFPVVKAFGLALGAGLPVAFAAACVLMPRPKEAATEHGASPLGLEILWWIYRLLGLRFLHLLASATGLCIWLSSPAVRKASPRLAKMRWFTQSLADKLVVMAQGRNLPRVETDGSPDAQAFVEDVQARRGVFVLSSHVGTVEVLAALGECRPVFHAWMEFDRTGVFNRFYLHHAKRRQVVIHPISSFGPQTVFEAGDALDAGDCLLMAADRTFGRSRIEKVGDREFELAEGAFRFAAALDHPVYFVACVAEGGCRYQAIVRRLTGTAKELAAAYARALAEVSASYPDQWFKWN